MKRPTEAIDYYRSYATDNPIAMKGALQSLVQRIDHLEANEIREVHADEVEPGWEVWSDDGSEWVEVTSHDKTGAWLGNKRFDLWIGYQQGTKLIVRPKRRPKTAEDVVRSALSEE